MANNSKEIQASSLKSFLFSEDVIANFREKKEIPLHFYNKNGQILIYRKEDATEQDFERLFRFIDQGIYYSSLDEDKLGRKKNESEVPGFSDTKLISEQLTNEMVADVGSLFRDLKRSSITTIQAKRTSQNMQKYLQQFEEQPDVMSGLINIIDELKQKGDLSYEVDVAIKRTVVAMAMKLRNSNLSPLSKKNKSGHEVSMTEVMQAALLCDISYGRMQMPTDERITRKQMHYIQNHPIYSFFMIAHEEEVSPDVKRMILFHHSPRTGSNLNNNYPSKSALERKLNGMRNNFLSNPDRIPVINSIDAQLSYLTMRDKLGYDEDINILCLASEFASLTSNVPWRKAMPPARAIRMIINNSFFTYPNRIIREFMDHTAVSLNFNKPVLKEGDYLILVAESLKGKLYFEVCRVAAMRRYQSRPGVERIGFIKPNILTEPKYQLKGVHPDNIVLDRRRAHYELMSDDSRRIVYIIDPLDNEELYQKLNQIAGVKSPA